MRHFIIKIPNHIPIEVDIRKDSGSGELGILDANNKIIARIMVIDEKVSQIRVLVRQMMDVTPITRKGVEDFYQIYP